MLISDCCTLQKNAEMDTGIISKIKNIKVPNFCLYALAVLALQITTLSAKNGPLLFLSRV